MAIERRSIVSRVALRLLMAAGAAALVAGCSDASRFSGDPFSDPTQSSASKGFDRAPTGTIAKPRSSDAASIKSNPLPPPTSGFAASAPPAPATSASAQNHWRAEGGTPIVVAQGETASMLATRYGVPTDALLRVNGFSSAQQVQPGARLVIPVYRATTAAAAPRAAKVAEPREEARPVAAKPAPAKATKADAAPAPHPQKGADARKPDQPKLAKAVKPEAVAEQEAKPVAASKPKLAKAAPAKEEAPAPVEKRVVRAPEKRETVKVAAAEKPAEAAPAAESSKVDKTPTASIQPAPEKASLAKDGTPEFRWPARGRVIQGFGSSGNDGINISVPEGTQVKAAEGGVVAYAGNELKNYGNLVLIRHDNGFVSAYANNSALEVKRGERVSRGQNIAKSGQTGSVGSPQLHFELRKGSTPVDPTGYLAGL